MSVTRKILIFCFLLICPSVLYAGITIETKNGATLEWDNYTEEANQYCTFKYGGRICISKNDVSSFKQEERSDIDVVMQSTVNQPTASSSIPSSAYSESEAGMVIEKKQSFEGINANISRWCAEKGGNINVTTCILKEYSVEAGSPNISLLDKAQETARNTGKSPGVLVYHSGRNEDYSALQDLKARAEYRGIMVWVDKPGDYQPPTIQKQEIVVASPQPAPRPSKPTNQVVTIRTGGPKPTTQSAPMIQPRQVQTPKQEPKVVTKEVVRREVVTVPQEPVIIYKEKIVEVPVKQQQRCLDGLPKYSWDISCK